MELRQRTFKLVQGEVKLYQNQNKEFLRLLAFKESTNNPQSINQFGYVGKYQFGRLALLDLGYEELFYNELRNKLQKDLSVYPEDKQDEDMLKLLTINKRYLGKKYMSYVGKTINGITLTESGMLAAAHLLGAGSVKRWIKAKGKITLKDGNGTTIEKYLQDFQGFNLEV